jgi:hypothetical protein
VFYYLFILLNCLLGLVFFGFNYRRETTKKILVKAKKVHRPRDFRLDIQLTREGSFERCSK